MPELETEVSIDIDVSCNDCGRDLSCNITKDKWGSPIINVDPCPDCLTAELEKGIEQGEENASK